MCQRFDRDLLLLLLHRGRAGATVSESGLHHRLRCGSGDHDRLLQRHDGREPKALAKGLGQLRRIDKAIARICNVHGRGNHSSWCCGNYSKVNQMDLNAALNLERWPGLSLPVSAVASEASIMPASGYHSIERLGQITHISVGLK